MCICTGGMKGVDAGVAGFLDPAPSVVNQPARVREVCPVMVVPASSVQLICN